jgi:predicted helicase
VKSYDNVWLLKDIPTHVRESLGLRTRDIGIDIVAERKGSAGNSSSTYVAVQCKFKSPNKWRKKTAVGWKELSTFYSLCARTGPWDRHIVMFNMDYVSHMGYKGEKDLSYCIGTFRNITKEQWEKMCGYKVHTLTDRET